MVLSLQASVTWYHHHKLVCHLLPGDGARADPCVGGGGPALAGVIILDGGLALVGT